MKTMTLDDAQLALVIRALDCFVSNLVAGVVSVLAAIACCLFKEERWFQGGGMGAIIGLACTICYSIGKDSKGDER